VTHRILVVALSLAIHGLLQPTAGAAEGEARTRYVVVLDDSVGAVGEAARQLVPEVQAVHTYRHALRGFAARLTATEVSRLRAAPGVAAVVPDRRLRISTSQLGPPWGLDRIDQHVLPRNNTFNYTGTGDGVTAYVIDTGIRASHMEFEDRVVTGADFVNGLPADDCNGHGTHVAGTLGSEKYGVAKEVTLVPVRVLGCWGGGSLINVLAGLDWVTEHHQPGQPAVANMSLGGQSMKVLNQAVKASIADGVTYAVAAGNEGKDACNYSPARVGPAITVSAVKRNDVRPWWANRGSCVDLFAPGVGIVSASNSSDTASLPAEGTSMAAPHAAGVAALYLDAHPTASPLSVRNAVYNLATKNVVGKAKSANKHLLYTNL
jgi:subtilisin family serine protease